MRCFAEEESTRVEVSYAVTAVSDEGDELARELANGFPIAIDTWKRLIESVL